jgi:hypothetical protein
MWSKDTLGFLLVGIGLIIAAIVVSIRTVRWISQTKIATGRVIRTEMTVDDEGSKSWHPVIEFTTDAGERSEFRSFVGGGAGTWKAGDPVEIRYDPANPQKAAINRVMYLFLVPIVLAFLGVIFAGIASYLHFSGAQQ